MEILRRPLIRLIAVALVCSSVFVSCERTLLGPDTADDPQSNFDALWRDFDRYYALFGVKKVDWDALYAEYRPRVGPQTTPGELWIVVTSMLKHLNDPHVYIWNPSGTKGFDAGFLEGKTMTDFDPGVVAMNYLHGIYRLAGGGRILYGRTSDPSIGYISISTFADDGWAADIDGVVRELADVRGMIIDIRGNPGGTSANCRYLASTFIDRPIDYFYTRTRSGPAKTDFGPPSLLSVAPRNAGWDPTKKIALLTNRFSGSSSDHFTWILKYHLPYVTQIGDTTVGDFGEVPNWRVLPNGWTYRFSARLVTTPDGVAPDSLNGIVPNVLIRNSASDIRNGRDRVMEYAERMLAH